MRNSAVPSPLVIDCSECVEQPISTTANFEEYQRNRKKALLFTPQELKKVSENKREDSVYIYFTPDEIWSLKDALKKIPPVSELKMHSPEDKNQRATVQDFEKNGLQKKLKIQEHEDKRQEFRALSDAQLMCKSSEEIDLYFQFLTPDEILEQNERLQRLKA